MPQSRSPTGAPRTCETCSTRRPLPKVDALPNNSSTYCPPARSPEIARLGKTLCQWKTAFLAYFDTDCGSNGVTEAINGIIELVRRIARGFRNLEHDRRRMHLITGGLDASPHTLL